MKKGYKNLRNYLFKKHNKTFIMLNKEVLKGYLRQNRLSFIKSIQTKTVGNDKIFNFSIITEKNPFNKKLSKFKNKILSVLIKKILILKFKKVKATYSRFCGLKWCRGVDFFFKIGKQKKIRRLILNKKTNYKNRVKNYKHGVKIPKMFSVLKNRKHNTNNIKLCLSIKNFMKNSHYYALLKQFIKFNSILIMSKKFESLYKSKINSEYSLISKISLKNQRYKKKQWFAKNELLFVKSDIRLGFYYTRQEAPFIEFQPRRGNISVRNTRIWLTNLFKCKHSHKKFKFLKNERVFRKLVLFWDKKNLNLKEKSSPQFVMRRYLVRGVSYDVALVSSLYKHLTKYKTIRLVDKKRGMKKLRFSTNKPRSYSKLLYKLNTKEVLGNLSVSTLPCTFSEYKEVNYCVKRLTLINSIIGSSSIQKTGYHPFYTRVPSFLCHEVLR